MRKALLVFLILTVGVLALAAGGCGGDDEGGPATGGETGTGEAAGGAAELEPIRLSFSTWNGYAGLVIGVESGMSADDPAVAEKIE